MDPGQTSHKAPPSSLPQRSSSRRRRRSSEAGSSSRRRRSSPSGGGGGGGGGSTRRSRRSSPDGKERRRRSSRSRSRSQSPGRAPEGFSVSKSTPHSATTTDKAYPSFDPRDQAPEDVGHGKTDYTRGPLDPNAPLVRGSLRLEGVNFAKYEGAKADPDRQRAFTSALRDDLISEAGNGLVREDILLRITPGPIKTVILDYNGGKQSDGQPGPPSLVDAEWCIDCEYAIAARDEERQVSIARTIFESLTGGDLRMDSTRKAYTRYLNPEHPDSASIRVVPTSSADAKPAQEAHPGLGGGVGGIGSAAAAAGPLGRCGLFEEGDPLEGRYTWHQRRSAHDLAAVKNLPDSPRSPPTQRPEERHIRSIGGVPIENRPVPDPSMLVWISEISGGLLLLLKTHVYYLRWIICGSSFSEIWCIFVKCFVYSAVWG